MGLLDDAIREHLDLKRRRGADPAEIERAEREALGPVRRAPEPEQVAPGAETAVAYDHEGEDWHEPVDEHVSAGVVEPEAEMLDHDAESRAADRFAEEFGTEDDSPQLAPEPDAHADEHESVAAPEQRRRRGFLGRRKEHHDRAEQERAAEPALPEDPFAETHTETPPHPTQPAGEPERPRDHPGGETVEYEVEAALEAESEKHADDVLEETPEFLQDTPDHDRLWFEQRPPRDFDFDG